MASDQEIASCVESLLRHGGGGGAISVDGVVRQLEAKLGFDLSHKASFIRDQIELLIGPLQRPPKDHFALNPHHQIQFHHPHHLQIPTSSHFAHLPHHHELAFRYPAPPPLPAATMAATIAAAAAAHQQLHQQSPTVPAPARPTVPAPAPKEGASAGVKRRGGPGGLSKVCGVSPELQAIVGEPTMARTQIVKQLWAYIRKNNLQDPSNKRKIICNDELRLVFETDCTDMFKMNKLLAKHIIPLEPTKDPGRGSKKLKTAIEEVLPKTECDPSQNIVSISDALANFFGTGEREMLHSEASTRIWDYIKANQLEVLNVSYVASLLGCYLRFDRLIASHTTESLHHKNTNLMWSEDPMTPMVILCDSKLQQLFGCESLSALGIQEMLARHLFKQS